jgi:hypothetical protein
MLKLFWEFIVLILLFANIFGNHSKKEKHVSDWLGIARVTFFILLTLAVIQFIVVFPAHIVWHIIWLLYLVAVYILMENTFRLKRETFGNPLQAFVVTTALVITLIIIIALF